MLVKKTRWIKILILEISGFLSDEAKIKQKDPKA